MQEQRKTPERKRCERHGLVANSNGACPLCEADIRSAKHRRVVKATVLAAVIAVVAAVLVRWQFAKPGPSGELPEESASMAVPAGPAGLEVTRHRPLPATGTGSVQAVPLQDRGGSLTPTEDSHLNEIPLQPKTPRSAPPPPPRASVDPEPRPPDDPRDFELPRQANRVR